jgi:hypothetical protein
LILHCKKLFENCRPMLTEVLSAAPAYLYISKSFVEKWASHPCGIGARWRIDLQRDTATSGGVATFLDFVHAQDHQFLERAWPTGYRNWPA